MCVARLARVRGGLQVCATDPPTPGGFESGQHQSQGECSRGESRVPTSPVRSAASWASCASSAAFCCLSETVCGYESTLQVPADRRSNQSYNCCLSALLRECLLLRGTPGRDGKCGCKQPTILQSRASGTSQPAKVQSFFQSAVYQMICIDWAQLTPSVQDFWSFCRSYEGK